MWPATIGIVYAKDASTTSALLLARFAKKVEITRARTNQDQRTDFPISQLENSCNTLQAKMTAKITGAIY